MTRILVTGSRTWTNSGAIAFALGETLSELATQLRDAGVEDWKDPHHYILVSGACPTGADRIAEEFWEKSLSCPVERHPAEWQRYGRGAGPRRNQDMVDLGADVCLAFLMPGSRGTADCVARAEKAGIPVKKVTV